ncbi:hypothetical protein O6H91_Y030000 [Diphasiastrum complanatum]|nr:hypothetical protein O6H91_Y030000 [Diphasiastrum complanatum]
MWVSRLLPPAYSAASHPPASCLQPHASCLRRHRHLLPPRLHSASSSAFRMWRLIVNEDEKRSFVLSMPTLILADGLACVLVLDRQAGFWFWPPHALPCLPFEALFIKSIVVSSWFRLSLNVLLP